MSMPAPSASPGPPLSPHFLPNPATGVRVVYADDTVAATDELNIVEALDDAIFAALEGDAEALETAVDAYRLAKRTAPFALLEESRRQYRRRARAVLKDADAASLESLPREFAAREVLDLVES